MENNTYSVYMHTFPNNKKYIGITSQSPTRRWGLNGGGYKGQSVIWSAIQEFGWDNIKHEILFYDLTEDEAKQKEASLISKYQTSLSEYGYNVLGNDNKDYTVARKNTKPHNKDSVRREQLMMLLSLYTEHAINAFKAITVEHMGEVMPIEKSSTTITRLIGGLLQGEYIDYGLKYGKFYSYFITDKGIDILKEYSLI